MNQYTRDYLTLNVPVPPPGPDEGPVCFTFDAKWVPYVISVVKSLTMDGVYASDQDRAKGEASLLLASFMEQFTCSIAPDVAGSEADDCMGCCIRMRDGVLQVLSCGEWVAVDGWNGSAIASLPTSPTNGTPVPDAGKCQTYIGKVNAASQWALPASVNTGDVVTVTNALGSWWTPLDLGIQRCPDGLIFFAGGCVDGTGHTEGTDPMPTAMHDALIGFDGTNYYDFSAAADGGPAVVTIGAGIVNKTLILMMNTPDTIGFGDVSFDIELCNNQTANWSHTFDFTLGTDGFSLIFENGADWGVWTGGVGFSWANHLQTGGDWWRGVWIKRIGIPSFALDSITAVLDWTGGPYDTTSDAVLLRANVAGSPTTEVVVLNTAMVNGSGQAFAGSTAVPATTDLDCFLSCSEASSSGGLSGAVVLKRLIVNGHGPNPF